MAREAQRKIINGHEWEVQPWPGMFGLKMKARIAPMLSGVITTLQSQSGAESWLDMDLQPMIEGFLSNVDEEKTPQLIAAMMHGASADGKDLSAQRHFDEHFSANYSELIKGIAFIVEVNYGDLFTMAADTGSPDSDK